MHLKSKDEESSEFVKLIVVGKDNIEIPLNVKSSSPLRELKRLYSDLQGVDISTIRFLLSHRLIEDDDTPEKLELENDEVIEVYNKYSTDGYIKLRIVGKDKSEVHYKVKLLTKIEKIKQSYSERQGVPVGLLHFLFNTRRINDEETLKQLKMEDGDVIEVSNEHPFFGKSLIRENVATKRKFEDEDGNVIEVFSSQPYLLINLEGEDDDQYIKVTLVNPASKRKNKHFFKLNISTNIGKLKKLYSECLRVNVDFLRFLFHGKNINDDDTPKQLKIKDGDIIKVYYKYTSGDPIDRFINFKLIHRNIHFPYDSLHYFKAKLSSKLIEHLCILELHGLPVSFHFNGRRIGNNDTPEQLEMKDGDEIEVHDDSNRSISPDRFIELKIVDIDYNEISLKLNKPVTYRELSKSYIDKLGQNGFVLFKKRNSLICNDEMISICEIKDGDVIDAFPDFGKYLELKLFRDNNQVRFKRTECSTIREIKKSYSDRVGIPEHLLLFLFDGRRIDDNETLEQLQIKNDDAIEVFHTQQFEVTYIDDKNTLKRLEIDNDDIIEVFQTQSYVIMTLREEKAYKYVKIRLVNPLSQSNIKLYIELELTSNMAKLMKFYSTSLGVSIDSLRFLFDGKLIKDEDTPRLLKMKDDDVIEVYQEINRNKTMEQTNAERANEYIQLNKKFKELKAKTPDDFIKLKVIYKEDNSESRYKVRLNASLGMLKRVYSGKQGISNDDLRFLFNGRQINDDETPKQLQMDEDDVIEVHRSQYGERDR